VGSSARPPPPRRARTPRAAAEPCGAWRRLKCDPRDAGAATSASTPEAATHRAARRVVMTTLPAPRATWAYRWASRAFPTSSSTTTTSRASPSSVALEASRGGDEGARRRGMGGEMRRAKSLRNDVHHANGVVWGPVYRSAAHDHQHRRHRRGVAAAASTTSGSDAPAAAARVAANDDEPESYLDVASRPSRFEESAWGPKDLSSILLAAMRIQVRSIQTCFTHCPVSTFDRIPFQLTDELFLYGMALSGRTAIRTRRADTRG